MISKDAIKLLKWFERNDCWIGPNEIKKNCKCFNERSLKTLITQKMLRARYVADRDNWSEYQISDSGKAYLEGLRAKRVPELREWISVVIGAATFLTGVLLSDPIKALFQWVWEMVT